MKKIKYNIPKGSKDCKGVECDQDLEFDIEVPDTTPNITNIPTPQITNPTATTTQVLVPPQPQITTKTTDEKKLSHEEMSDLIPKGVNAMACPGGDCGHMKLKNPKQTKKFKSCPNCDANTLTKDAEFCPYCTKNVDADDLEDGIELEEEE